MAAGFGDTVRLVGTGCAADAPQGDDVTVALIAAITGVLGVVLGRMWDHRSEASRWRRDQKIAGYQRFVEQFRTTCEHIRTVALADHTPAEFAELVTTARTETAGWDDAYAVVRLIGSRRVVVAAAHLDAAITDLFDAAQQQQHTREQWASSRQPTYAAFATYIIAARRELRLEPVPAQYYPELASPPGR
ncbi:hypothetical protein ACWEKT_31925 [Nocardia takedensis]